MKLIKGIITEQIGNDYVAVATGEASRSFNGLIRNNRTADFLFKQLMLDKDEEQLVEALLDKYNVTKDVAIRDVEILVSKLREAGLLDE